MMPDILIAQTWTSFIDPQVFDEIRCTYGTLIVNIGMDDRHQFWGDRIQGGGGEVPTEDVPRLFAQSKIFLGVRAIGHCSDFYALKCVILMLQCREVFI
ncbi:hypothetical protein GCM10008066_11440 [Oxalicibacterium faecigallinarum]|uniref:Uncharacterized protein n=1 Tax=Oxalicibacterium faecigallinarum TaxID=573741 RepID=A0A8J3AX80_9BURK|nr:hypothetical protein GCM10008066_11440 [Oxalicibacterium faecigallinarum]